MTPASTREEADFVIFNTCCVRDNAQRRALGNVVWLKELKKTRPELMVGVCGCMMQQPGMGEQILKQYPFVDLAFGTHNLYRFAQLMLKAVRVPPPRGRSHSGRRREYSGGSARPPQQPLSRVYHHHVRLQQFLLVLHCAVCPRPRAFPRVGTHHRGSPRT